MADWAKLVDLKDIGEGMTAVTLDGRGYVVAVIEDEYVCFDALCPHRQASLIDGFLEENVVTCPLHGWRFDLQSKGKEIHGYRSLRTYETRVENGTILIKMENDL
ncbi:Rieske (2Fe-2S) protein [Castellaniella sp. GW247-6E4]|uniref:Rieske (2Fe-2S) protein n=1 Tax=Castellaniella sp. GW247-6E4 TaxID=3140380 RepID=UPI0033160984